MLTLTNPTAADAAALNSYTFISGSITEVIPIDEIQVDSVLVPFGKNQNDNVELHIYNINDILLESAYQIPYTLAPGPGSSTTITDLNNVKIDLHNVFRGLGYISGKFKFQLNFHRDYLGTQQDPALLGYINQDRTQVNVYYSGSVDALLNAPLVDNYSNRLEYYLNLGDNEVYRISSFNKNLDLSTTKLSVYTITLQSALTADVALNSSVWVDLQLADTVNDSIIIYPKKKGDPLVKLRPANYGINTIDDFATGTGYKTWNQLLGTNPTSSQQLINNLVSSSFDPIDLNIDYRDYSNFVFYGSATERLKNFKYKLGLVEYYDSILSTLGSIPYSATESNNNILDITSKKNAILSGFDGYEKYLYYESGSYESSSYGEFTPATWPKTNSTYPYTLYSISSPTGISWYEGQLSSASLYDKNNMNSLARMMPEFMVNSGYYDSFEMYANMLGQHFDILWSYANALGDIKTRKESLYEGVAKDLVYHVLKSFGIDVLNGYQAEELWFNELPVNISGSYTQLGEFPSIASKDINKEVFKRILNNLPYLLKTKGTERGIRALINCYGVPSTVYRIREYSGPYSYKSKNIIRNTKYKKVEKYTQQLNFNYGDQTYLGNNLALDLSLPNSWKSTVTTVQLRFKPVNIGFVSQGLYDANLNTSIILYPSESNSDVGILYIDGVARLSGSFFNGKWNNLTYSTTLTGTSSLYCLQSDGGVIVSEVSNSFTNSKPITGSTWRIGVGNGATFAYPFSGSMQEFRLWNSILPIEVIRQHALNPQSIIGSGSVDIYTSENWQSYNSYDYKSGYSQLLCRFPMGSTLELYDVYTYDTGSGGYTINMPSIHPNKSIQVSYLVDGTSIIQPTNMAPADWTGSYVGNNYEDYYVWSPNLGDSLDISNKIRIEDSKLDGQLSNTTSIEHSQYDTYQLDSPKVGVFFSPQDEINEDIADQFSGILLDDFIGDPRDDYNPSYAKLDELRSLYNAKFTDRNTFWKYTKLVENFDSSMFYLIKKFLPARAVKMVGLVVQPTVLERPKIRVQRPLDFDSIALDTGLSLVENINFQPTYDNYEADISLENLSLADSESVTIMEQLPNLNPTELTGDLNDLSGTITTEFGALQIDGYQELAYIHDNTEIVFKSAGSENHTFLGCKITSPGFNIPSPDTFDGKPVVEYWTTGPSNIMNELNPGGLLNL